MTLNKEQFTKLVENYASHIINELDNDSLELMVFDLLVREYETYTEEQIVEEIIDLYDEDMVAELMPTVED
jgi:anaerobic ribonucleoside-triphosphate reductase